MQTANKFRYILVHSDLLGEEIILVSDKLHFAEVLEKHPDHVLYFRPEIEVLHSFASDPDFVKHVHAIKKNFKGWIIPDDSVLGLHLKVVRLRQDGTWESLNTDQIDRKQLGKRIKDVFLEQSEGGISRGLTKSG